MGCGKMKSGGTIKKVKKMAKGGAAGYNYGIPLNGLPMRPTNGNTDISKNQMGTNPTMKLGGSKDENCWPGKPGCGYKKAQRVNKRRSNANKVGPVLKKIGTAIGALGAGALAYTKNVGGIKDKIQGLKQQKMGGTTRKMSRGGALKPVPAGKVGLSKLPTPVRNKMGYQKKGGSVKKK
jgi:hypothetical protein